MKRLFIPFLILITIAGYGQQVNFNFTKNPVSIANWINVSGDPYLGIRTAADPATGITISSVSTTNWTPYSGASAYDGGGSASGTFMPASVMVNHWFQYSALASYDVARPQLEVGGLNPAGIYTLIMTGSNASGFVSNPTRFRVSGSVVSSAIDVNTNYNTTAGAPFNNISPDANGTIRIYINTTPGTALADISGLQIITANTSLSANAGANQAIMLPANSVTLTGSGNDPNGTITSYSWQKLSGGAATILSATSATTSVTDLVEGVYTFKLTISNSLSETASANVNVIVSSASSTSNVNFNFTKAPVPVSGWTNVSGDPAVGVRTATDQATGISISSVATANWVPYSGTSAYDGGGSANGTFMPGTVMANHWFQYSGLAVYDASKPQLELSGLNPATIYTLEMTGSNIYAFNSNPTRYIVSGSTTSSPFDVNTNNNTAAGATFPISPDVNGKIRIYVNTTASTSLADISGIKVLAANNSLSANAGANQTITLPTNSVTLIGSGNAPTGTITGYLWEKLSGGAATIVSAAGASTSVTGLGEGVYTFKLTVTNSLSETASSNVTITVAAASSPTSGANFNLTKAAVSVTGWTNVSGDPSLGIRTATDQPSGISISSVSTANWFPYSGSTAFDGGGSSTGTFMPGSVMANHWFQYSAAANYDLSKPQFELTGLNAGSVYTLKMTGSNIYNLNSSPTHYIVSGTVVSAPVPVNTNGNTTNGATFSNISPDANGKIRVYVNTISSTELANICGIQIASGTGSPTSTISITSPASNSSHALGNQITIDASPSGSVGKVEFYQGTTKIGEDLTAPFTYSWAAAPAGSHSLTVKAFANDVLLATSPSITISVTAPAAPNGWSLAGNATTAPGTNFIGTTDNQRLVFKTNNIEQMTILPNGNVGIGTIKANDPDYKLFVAKGIRTNKVKVDNIINWPDYVFKPSYKLPTLKDIEKFIAINGHLPGVPSAKEVEKEGINLSDNQAILLKKIEELSLYMIELNKKLERLSNENEGLKKKLKSKN